MKYTLVYWRDDDAHVGELREFANVFSQGRTLRELEENVRDAYEMLEETGGLRPRRVEQRTLRVDV